MTTNLIPLLTRLHQAAPEMCQQDNQVFSLGGYRFWMQGAVFGFTAYYPDDDTQCYGRLALDWLAGALMAAIEARGWGWDVRKDVTRGAFVFTSNGSYEADHAGTTAEALLAALVAAVEAERVR